MLAITLRVLGAALILASLVFPRAGAQASGGTTGATAGPASVTVQATVVLGSTDDDGGACGEDPQVESLDCSDMLDGMDQRLDEPFAIALLRTVELYMSEQACTQLLADIWSQQSCQAQGRDCGKMNSGAPPGPAPKLASSSASAQSIWAGLGLGHADIRRHRRGTNVRGPTSRDLQPPVPPPRLLGH
jgi:hypothetical protein